MRVRFPLLFLILTLMSTDVFSNTYVVTNTNDSGTGSLREALTGITNGFTGNHNITFNIPMSDAGYDAETGTFTIAVPTDLPYLLFNANVTIDATTQTANVGNTNPDGPEIVLDGRGGNAQAGFRIASANCTVKGFAIGGFTYGILFFGANGGIVTDCHIGIDATGTLPFPNAFGIGLSGGTYGGYTFEYAHNVVISGNVISGNTTAGVAIVGAHDNILTGNRVGTNALGTAAVPNTQGIYLTSAAYGNLIGGSTATARNIISGNTSGGVILDGAGTSDNVISGNFIGVDVSGDAPLGNHHGIVVMTNANRNQIGGSTAAERNIISANSEIGIYIESSDSNVVCGNYIGLNRDGSRSFVDEQDTALQANGVEINTTGKHNIIGGHTAAERNVISGHKIYGCIYYGNCSDNNIVGNYIGTDATGSFAIPNATGICVDGSSHRNIMENNLLSGNRSYGLFIVTRGTDENVFRGNRVGTNADATAAIPNDVGLMLAANAQNNLIGGPDPADRNIFSGNRYAGIEVTDLGTEGNRIVGNYIGVDGTGLAALPNENGIIVSALVHHLSIEDNIVSANTGFGVVITDRADSVMLYRNKIGVGSDGETALGNGACGVFLGNGAHGNSIGGEAGGNIIAYNDSAAVVLMDAVTTDNRISRNSIHDNQYAGIDIFPWGVNANDPNDSDDGCNHLMNYPVIESVVYDNPTGRTTITGHLDTPDPGSATVELFTSDAAESIFTPREGKRYLTSITPYPDGTIWLQTDDVQPSDFIIATATDRDGNTSEFSAASNITVGIAETRAPEISLWPNPTSHYVYLNTKAGAQYDEIRIFDARGQLLFTQKAEAPTTCIDLSALACGIYWINVVSREGKVKIFKIVKSK
ncbi:MAG: right-handed parallel beta-helix repeat-containing protein [Bacteroidales bacterium]|nr:right-handed parallel beta-helix repeat-containing protein [Bacteroidales bacterium]